jgi:hypothetical protein
VGRASAGAPGSPGLRCRPSRAGAALGGGRGLHPGDSRDLGHEISQRRPASRRACRSGHHHVDHGDVADVDPRARSHRAWRRCGPRRPAPPGQEHGPPPPRHHQRALHRAHRRAHDARPCACRRARRAGRRARGTGWGRARPRARRRRRTVSATANTVPVPGARAPPTRPGAGPDAARRSPRWRPTPPQRRAEQPQGQSLRTGAAWSGGRGPRPAPCATASYAGAALDWPSMSAATLRARDEEDDWGPMAATVAISEGPHRSPPGARAGTRGSGSSSCPTPADT